ncbi:hormogonium polysaccharide biosynthesis glycosyltransferase HpsE [Leptothoe sp. PORK10 BA2]|uniref:hormogonium polysaccharide biosynthesis glycosyltransferase HpsE n=1 Tax=Leptothoe sp. PORK10 BA2 TaxID=3110254 RepID=UPI002B20DA9B|nr:hormogonium polysaccharide biosynthesis glycosyltransferase HpsE [Leptothoe sp. PORK10 BA2]MEA5462604.1 hormogonium polysaccharide biosynthesis glycosyltransferase HpsE [Leptothoe sp. PORK10 BA2]
MTDFSVVICTYNGEHRLPILLDRLRGQRLPQTLTWEILIVDNNSRDQTAQCIHTHQQQWPTHSSLRYIFEPRQGLAYARRCAMQVANSELVGFLDDDTLPAEDWVAQAYEFGQGQPQVGAYGSAINGQYESQPPQGFERIASCLAIIQRGDTAFPYERQGVLPAGAGMVIRRRAWQQCVPVEPALKGVCGTSLQAKGEDVETLSYIRQGGWPIWHNPQMQLTHVIPETRLRPAYLLHLFQSIGVSRYALRCVRYHPWRRPWMLLMHGVNDLRKLLVHIIKTKQLYPTDIVTACERTLLVHSFLSPIHGLWVRLFLPPMDMTVFREQP